MENVRYLILYCIKRYEPVKKSLILNFLIKENFSKTQVYYNIDKLFNEGIIFEDKDEQIYIQPIFKRIPEKEINKVINKIEKKFYIMEKDIEKKDEIIKNILINLIDFYLTPD